MIILGGGFLGAFVGWFPFLVLGAWGLGVDWLVFWFVFVGRWPCLVMRRLARFFSSRFCWTLGLDLFLMADLWLVRLVLVGFWVRGWEVFAFLLEAFGCLDRLLGDSCWVSDCFGGCIG